MSIYDLFNIQGCTALITGAGRGIGRVIAYTMAEAGCMVALLGLHRENLEKVAGELGGKCEKILVLPADVSRRDEIDASFQQVESTFGRLDICINNAGVSQQVPAEDISEADWERIIDVNLKGVFLCCQAAARLMIPKKSGTIINIGSISASAVNVPQKQAVYNASKAGVVMLSRSLAVEWAPHGIRVNSLSPGYIETEMTRSTMSHLFPVWRELIPMERLGKPDDLRGALLYLASDASVYMTGHDMIVDGGYMAR
ncbi:MAG TPA: SDR family oxidoreductase [Dehalococcoidia bacterium]|nr:SDR family oxidoreductase [Dehalococcoidia bacterium]